MHGPLLQFYDSVTAYGDRYGRELIYQLQTPLYAQLSFTSYYTECLRHCVNFSAKWPTLIRLVLQENCSINISGKVGHAVEMDGYAEAKIVKPLKWYASGHSTVTMCERTMGNLDLLRTVRKVYKARDCFYSHPSMKYSIQSSFPDQLKGAWFCLKQDFFKNKKRKDIKCYPISTKGVPSGKVPSNLIDIMTKEKRKS